MNNQVKKESGLLTNRQPQYDCSQINTSIDSNQSHKSSLKRKNQCQNVEKCHFEQKKGNSNKKSDNTSFTKKDECTNDYRILAETFRSENSLLKEKNFELENELKETAEDCKSIF